VQIRRLGLNVLLVNVITGIGEDCARYQNTALDPERIEIVTLATLERMITADRSRLSSKLVL
jgi:hypothetical protein